MMHTALTAITAAGGEMDYQTIPEKTVDGNPGKRRVVIRVFTTPLYLPAIKQTLGTHRLYLQCPVDLGPDCPYYNCQELQFGDEIVFTNTGEDGSEYRRKIILPKGIA
jgi:hypothetical protein